MELNLIASLFVGMFDAAIQTFGYAGFAALYAVKAVATFFGLRWLRDWNSRRKGLGQANF
ncbi:MAG: hypothetical protein AB3N23_09365 [Paracoccaceae bacterium]